MIRPLPSYPPAYGRVLLNPRHPGTGAGLRDFAEKLRSMLPPFRRVLDVGGQDGWLNHWLKAPVYVSVDIDDYGDNRICDAHNLAFDDGDYELVVSKQCLPRFADPIGACSEMFRVASRYVVIRQEWPGWPTDIKPIGWAEHSQCQIDSPKDLLPAFSGARDILYDGIDLVVTK